MSYKIRAVWALILLEALSRVGAKSNKCEFNLDSRRGKHSPLITNKDGTTIYPVGGRILTFDEGQEFLLVCHGTEKAKNHVLKSTVQHLKEDAEEVGIKCSKGSFKLGDSRWNVDVYEASCKSKLEPEILKHASTDEKSLCADVGADGRLKDLVGNINMVQIGFNAAGSLHELIRLCIDEKVYGTLWTHHIVRGASIDHRGMSSTRPPFRRDTTRQSRYFPCASSTITSAYSKESQVKTIEELLDTSNRLPTGETIIDACSSSANYFAKGHLSPDAAFIYDVEQDATYYYINVAPQFQSFNNGNWKALEMATRTIGSRRGRDISVYTGTFDQLEYPNKSGKKTLIDLLWKPSKTVESAIPVPKYYWKVIHDPTKNEAVAFLGLNDPHSPDVVNYLVPNICDKLNWVDWGVDDEKKGHMTCCTPEELRKVVTFAPDLSDKKGKWPDLLSTEADK